MSRCVTITETEEVMHNKEIFKVPFKQDLSERVQLCVKVNLEGSRFFDLRERNKNQRFTKSGIFLSCDDVETFKDAINKTTVKGQSNSYPLPSGRTLQIVQKDDDLIKINVTRYSREGTWLELTQSEMNDLKVSIPVILVQLRVK